jgi:hypothetical protein
VKEIAQASLGLSFRAAHCFGETLTVNAIPNAECVGAALINASVAVVASLCHCCFPFCSRSISARDFFISSSTRK